MDIPILNVRRDWYCPNCTQTDTTFRGDVHQQMHHCRGLKGLIAPLLEVGTAAKVVAKEREDYVNGELVQYDPDGRPVMAVETVRDEGNDLIVLAPAAGASARFD
jgi:hypothetical protein